MKNWYFLVLLLLAACSAAPSPIEQSTVVAVQTAAATAVSTPTVPPPTPPTTAAAAETATAAPATPIDDREAETLLNQLAFGTQKEATTALQRILDANDPRFIAPLIELFRNGQIGIVRVLGVSEIIDGLEQLSGEAFGRDWGSWIEWYGGTDHLPPPGFTKWKGRMFSLIDPRFGEFLRGGLPNRIRVEEIQWGGVVVDGIPALEQAAMVAAETADYLAPEDAVFGLAINGDARAYPLRIMDWHEMANDVVGGVPVSIAYCTLCGAAVAYDGRASDGNTYTFGSSGFLFRSNKLMYDRQTQTLWNQLTGEPVLGELADSDVALSLLPIVLTTWEEWQALHPQTVVLDVETGYQRDYTAGSAYGDYFAATGTMFPVWQRSDLLDTKAHIYALRLDGVPKAYPLTAVNEAQVINDTVGQTAVVLVAGRAEAVAVAGVNRRAGRVTYTAGGEVRAYDRGNYIFSPGEMPDTLVDENGRLWQVTEDALVGPEGETAVRLGGHLAYWFGWFAFFPQTELYGQ